MKNKELCRLGQVRLGVGTQYIKILQTNLTNDANTGGKYLYDEGGGLLLSMDNIEAVI